MNDVVLYRIDDAKRMYRYYRLDVQPNLFGEWCLMREWGRIGSTGKMRSLPFPTPQEAYAAFWQRREKERRGYQPAPFFTVGSACLRRTFTTQ
jgi:predicted DNA-binding WGR domain protein